MTIFEQLKSYLEEVFHEDPWTFHEKDSHVNSGVFCIGIEFRHDSQIEPSKPHEVFTLNFRKSSIGYQVEASKGIYEMIKPHTSHFSVQKVITAVMNARLAEKKKKVVKDGYLVKDKDSLYQEEFDYCFEISFDRGRYDFTVTERYPLSENLEKEFAWTRVGQVAFSPMATFSALKTHFYKRLVNNIKHGSKSICRDLLEVQ